MKPLRRLATLPIRAYQRWISPYKPPTCRFEPTCSAYAVEAVETHGVLKGFVLTSWRILRCQPFSEPGPDPVPARGAWKNPVSEEEPAPHLEGATPADESDSQESRG